jgi:hypothetical protein
VRRGEELEGKACDHSWLAGVVLREKGLWKLAYTNGDYLVGSIFEWFSMGFCMHIG